MEIGKFCSLIGSRDQNPDLLFAEQRDKCVNENYIVIAIPIVSQLKKYFLKYYKQGFCPSVLLNVEIPDLS